jgi:2-C-methyl-D-erythritol 4-phosphate cytidylyltransferase
MSQTKKISMWIEWSDQDGAFLGYCPQFFPYGAVCDAHTEAKALMKLATLVKEELEQRAKVSAG